MRKKVALSAVKKVSKFLSKQFRVVRSGVAKPDGTLVSTADRGAEKILLSAIKKAFPDDGILSEESLEIPSRSGYRWIIDPLDGTHNFLAGLPMFGCLLALEFKGKVIFSICSFPVLNELFVAEKGKGATCNGKKIHADKSSKTLGAICSVDGNKKLPLPQIFSDIKKCVELGFRWRMFGACAYSMAQVARGAIKIAIGRLTNPWDIAAPAFLVECAFGKVTNLDGKPWSVTSKSFIATNGSIHKEALKIVTE